MSAITPDAPDGREHSAPSTRGYYMVLAVAILLSVLALAAFYVVSAWQEESAPVGSAFVAADGPELSLEVNVIEGWRGSVLVFAPVYIDDAGPYIFAVDTGASRTIISHDVVRELRLKQSGDAGQVTGVTGTTEAHLIDITYWRIGDVQLPETTAMSLALPKIETEAPMPEFLESNSMPEMHGLLGSDVLSQFGSILLDYESEILLLRPEDPAASDDR